MLYFFVVALVIVSVSGLNDLLSNGLTPASSRSQSLGLDFVWISHVCYNFFNTTQGFLLMLFNCFWTYSSSLILVVFYHYLEFFFTDFCCNLSINLWKNSWSSYLYFAHISYLKQTLLYLLFGFLLQSFLCCWKFILAIFYLASHNTHNLCSVFFLIDKHFKERVFFTAFLLLLFLVDGVIQILGLILYFPFLRNLWIWYSFILLFWLLSPE